MYHRRIQQVNQKYILDHFQLPTMGLGIGVPAMIPLRDPKTQRENVQCCRLSGLGKYVFDTAAAYYSISPSSLASIVLSYYCLEVLPVLVDAGLIPADTIEGSDLV